MSTNIHNGYKLPSGISVTDFVRSLEATFSDARYRAIVRSLSSLIVDIEDAGGSEEAIISALKFATHEQIDLDRIKMMGLSRPPLRLAKDVLFKLQDSFSNRYAQRIPSLDVTLSISFLSDPASPGDIYALVYTEVDEYIKVWESIEGIREFFYWDGSDSQLASMTRKEWKNRQKTWDSITGNLPPVINAVKWEMETIAIATMTVDEADISAAVAEERVSRAASLVWAQKLWGDNPMFEHLFQQTKEDEDKDDEND